MKLDPGTELLCQLTSFIEDDKGYTHPKVEPKTVYFQAILATGELLVNDEDGNLSYIWAKYCKIVKQPRNPRYQGPPRR